MIDRQMGWVDHFTDLRKRMLATLGVLVLTFMVSLSLISQVYSYLVRPLHGQKLMVVAPGEVISVYLMVSGVVAIGLTLPFVLFQIWTFVSPGLNAVERRYTLRLLPVAVLMFVTGICFAWFLVFPTVLSFLLRLSAEQFTVMLRASAYFSFLSDICLPFGFIFELPVIVTFLTRIGLITPSLLRKLRRYAYLVSVVLGVMISPPELISHLCVVVPMIALYEISIVLSAATYRRISNNAAN